MISLPLSPGLPVQSASFSQRPGKIVGGPTDFGKPCNLPLRAALRPPSGTRLSGCLRFPQGALISVGPERFARERDGRIGPDIVTRRGAQFEDLQAVAGEIDVVDRLRALVAAIEDMRVERVAAAVCPE